MYLKNSASLYPGGVGSECQDTFVCFFTSNLARLCCNRLVFCILLCFDAVTLRSDRSIDETRARSEGEKRALAISDTVLQPESLSFDDVAGLNEAKQTLREAIIMPLKFPHLFTGK